MGKWLIDTCQSDKRLLVYVLYVCFGGVYLRITYQVHGIVKQFIICNELLRYWRLKWIWNK
jgi:hypothetical protein